MLPSTGAVMQLLREDQTTRRGVQIACGVIALATLALAACNNENQTGPGGAVSVTDRTGVGQTSTVSSNSATTLTVSPALTATPDVTSNYVILQTSTTLQDTTKSRSTNLWAGRPDSITAGTGAGQTRTVSSNTKNTLTVSPAWTTTPDGTSKYVILQTSTTLQDTTKLWHINIWTGRPVTITAGTGVGQTSTVSSNTKNTLTVSPAWTTIPDGTSKYAIRQTSTTLQDNTKE